MFCIEWTRRRTYRQIINSTQDLEKHPAYNHPSTRIYERTPIGWCE